MTVQHRDNALLISCHLLWHLDGDVQVCNVVQYEVEQLLEPVLAQVCFEALDLDDLSSSVCCEPILCKEVVIVLHSCRANLSAQAELGQAGRHCCWRIPTVTAKLLADLYEVGAAHNANFHMLQ